MSTQHQENREHLYECAADYTSNIKEHSEALIKLFDKVKTIETELYANKDLINGPEILTNMEYQETEEKIERLNYKLLSTKQHIKHVHECMNLLLKSVSDIFILKN